MLRRSVTAIACVGVLFVAAAGSRAAGATMIGDPAERASVVAMGRATYQRFCAACHGPQGKGGGPVQPALLTTLPDLTRLTQSKGRFPLAELEAILFAPDRNVTPSHVDGQMPRWGSVFLSIDSSVALAHVRAATLIAYVESIQEQRAP